MIEVITYTDGLPVSIIVPLENKRKDFFYQFVLPALEANIVREIIVNDNAGTAPVKRNAGFDKSTQPYIFMCDDDIILPNTHINRLYDTLINSRAKYAYSGYHGIVRHPSHTIKQNFMIPTRDFDASTLRQFNYISTMALIERKAFPRFDETLSRFQDWDLYLTMLANGHKGIAVHDNEFLAFYLDEGITSARNSEVDAYNRILTKHGL